MNLGSRDRADRCGGIDRRGGLGGAEAQGTIAGDRDLAISRGCEVAGKLATTTGADGDGSSPQAFETHRRVADIHGLGLHLHTVSPCFADVNRSQGLTGIQLRDGARCGDVVLLIDRLQCGDLLWSAGGAEAEILALIRVFKRDGLPVIVVAVPDLLKGSGWPPDRPSGGLIALGCCKEAGPVGCL